MERGGKKSISESKWSAGKQECNPNCHVVGTTHRLLPMVPSFNTQTGNFQLDCKMAGFRYRIGTEIADSHCPEEVVKGAESISDVRDHSTLCKTSGFILKLL